MAPARHPAVTPDNLTLFVKISGIQLEIPGIQLQSPESSSNPRNLNEESRETQRQISIRDLMIRSYLVPHTTLNGGHHHARGGGRPKFDNTTRTHQRGLRPSLTPARSRLSHATCGTHTLARARTQHCSAHADGMRATPVGSHSSLCARAAAATKAASYPSKMIGKSIAAPARQLAPTCAANHRSPLIERVCDTRARHTRPAHLVC